MKKKAIGKADLWLVQSAFFVDARDFFNALHRKKEQKYGRLFQYNL